MLEWDDIPATASVEVGGNSAFAKLVPPSSFTNEARQAIANAYNAFKKGD